MKHTLRWLVIAMLLPLLAQAAEPLPMPTSEPATKRFFPLDGTRQDAEKTKGGLAITKERKPFVLRSDTSQLQNGFMRIDRARSVAIPLQHALAAKDVAVDTAALAAPAATATPAAPAHDEGEQAARESEEIEGNRETYDPVLALFGDAGDAPSSFAEAMRGQRSLPSMAGLKRHMAWPIPLSVKQSISSGYGMRADPFHGRPAFHGGIDIVAPTGTPVLATADGQVMQVATDGNYGKYITLQHADGTLSRYGHLSAQSVRVGQQVRAGQPIGAVGSTGRSTGAHLDYRVSKNNMKFDPLAILNLPSSVAFNGIKPVTVAAATTSAAPQSRIASKPLPRAPMLIKVQ